MLSKTQALVLRLMKIGDKRVIVDMFTREQGRVAFAVTLSQAAGGRMKASYFQPLTLLNIEADVRPARQLQRLKEVELALPVQSLLVAGDKLAQCLFLGEFLCYALRGEQADRGLFDFLAKSIAWLDTAQGGTANFHLVAVMRLTRFLGFYPNLETEGDWFDLRAGTFCDAAPVHGDCLRPGQCAALRTLMRLSYATMHVVRLSAEERGQVLDVLLRYCRLHLPAFPELKSVPVLKEVFHC